MEQYLVNEYGVIEDEKWLSNEQDIEAYFMDCAYDYFDCGQGYYQDEASVICKISDNFYKVDITAEIGSAKQDRGDRLYWVDAIESVKYKQIDKPQPKDRNLIVYKMYATKNEEILLDAYLSENLTKYEKVSD